MTKPQKDAIILMYKKGELREQLSSARAAKFAVALIMTKKSRYKYYQKLVAAFGLAS